MSLLATQHSGLLARFILAFIGFSFLGGEGEGALALLSSRENVERMKPLQLLWESLGIVGTQETHLDPLSALSTFDIPGGFRVALVSPSVGQFLPLPLAPAEGDYKSEKAPGEPSEATRVALQRVPGHPLSVFSMGLTGGRLP